jgi:beta-glucosidase
VKAATGADVVIYVGGWIHGFSDGWNDNWFDSEGVDKANINLPFGQEELLKAVQKANAKNVVILFGGAATDMTAWEKQAKGILQAWYPGMEGGTAMGKILFGQTNPSGKLPMTFPKKLQDSPAHANGSYPGDKDNKWKTEYKEGILVGYRYFDTKKIEPLFPFGHGLSYTTFSFDNIVVTKGDKKASIKLTVKNTGSTAGAEVVQVYVKDDESSVEKAEKELKAFEKVFLQPGEAKEVEISLDEAAFQYYDEAKKSWVLEPGKYSILVGSSSKDIKLRGEVTF